MKKIPKFIKPNNVPLIVLIILLSFSLSNSSLYQLPSSSALHTSSSDGFTKRVQDISDSLGKELRVQHANVSYTSLSTASDNQTASGDDKKTKDVYGNDVRNKNRKDASRSEFEKNYGNLGNAAWRGMAGLYNFTNIVIDLLIGEETLPDGLVLYENGRFRLADDALTLYWSALLRTYGPLLVTVLLIVITFGAVIPLVGFAFCCCRCCGRCGARSQPFDKRYDMCKKVVLAAVLICVLTAMLAGVVCVFVTNEHVRRGVEDFPQKADNNVDETKKFVGLTKRQLDILLVTNYQELETSLTNALDTSGAIVTNKLVEYSHAVAVSHLASAVNELPRVRVDLLEMRRLTNILRANASKLNDGLRHVKNELLHELENCKTRGVPECTDFRFDVAKLDTTIDFNNLPDVTESLNNVTALLSTDVIDQVERGQRAFLSIREQIQQAVDTSVPHVKDALHKAGLALASASNSAGMAMDEFVVKVEELIHSPRRKQAEKYLTGFNDYRWYIGLGAGIALLCVVTCASCGLLCGICGRRPDAYSDDCCDKGSGSKFLMLTFALIILSSPFLALYLGVMMPSGGISQRGVCEPLRHVDAQYSMPHWKLLDDIVDLDRRLNYTSGGITLGEAIIKCHNNMSIYQVLNLKQRIDLQKLENYLDKYKISSQIQDLKDRIRVGHDIQILTPEAKLRLQELANSGISEIKFDRFTEILRDNMTSISLSELSSKLSETSHKIEHKPALRNVSLALYRNSMMLDVYHRDLVTPMVSAAETLRDTAVRLEASLKFNQSSVTDLLAEVEHAQNYLKRQGTEDVAKIAEDFAVQLETRVREYLQRVSVHIETDVACCGPVSSVYNSTVSSVCDDIILPYNGYWVSLAWCALLYVPIAILSIKLATLYQKSDPYPGPLVEENYNKHVKRRRQPRRDIDSDALSRRPNDVPDARYADMANKHWEDFPEGGPPQYHRSPPASTEYERPPPYYYPGPENRP